MYVRTSSTSKLRGKGNFSEAGPVKLQKEKTHIEISCLGSWTLIALECQHSQTTRVLIRVSDSKSTSPKPKPNRTSNCFWVLTSHRIRVDASSHDPGTLSRFEGRLNRLGVPFRAGSCPNSAGVAAPVMPMCHQKILLLQRGERVAAAAILCGDDEQLFFFSNRWWADEGKVKGVGWQAFRWIMGWVRDVPNVLFCTFFWYACTNKLLY